MLLNRGRRSVVQGGDQLKNKSPPPPKWPQPLGCHFRLGGDGARRAAHLVRQNRGPLTPAVLPIQHPPSSRLLINLALGLAVSPLLLARTRLAEACARPRAVGSPPPP